MELLVEGGQQIKLAENDFVTEGGEGKIYLHNQMVYKIYTDPNKMIPAAKIKELAVLDHPAIIRPQRLLFDKKQQAVGFTMQPVTRAISLPRLFTNDFRARYQISNDKILLLLEKMQETLQFIHQHHCLMVDGNEMNYLVDESTYQKPYFIDVDSYQTPHFPATALMPSIRDYHSQGFSPLTDWFAFAIIACQLLVGIHPYKGKHPQFAKTDLAGRMQANLSIFNPAVTLPSAVRHFSVIPKTLYDWFIQLFEQGQRLPPPVWTTTLSFVPARVILVQSTQQLTINLLRQLDRPITAYSNYRGIHTIIAGQRVLIDAYEKSLTYPKMHIIYAPETFVPLAAGIRNYLLHIENLQSQQAIAVTLKAEHLLSVNNHLYVIQQNQLIAVKIIQRANKILVSSGKSWAILPLAHQVLDGCLYQTVLGKPYLVVPFSEEACVIKAIPELTGYRIISGKHENGVIMLIGHQQGRYDQMIIRFDKNYQRYKIRILEHCEFLDNNFVTLNNDKVIHIPHDGELVIFHRYDDTQKSIVDPQIYTTMRLAHNMNKVLFYTDNRLYSLEMKV